MKKKLYVVRHGNTLFNEKHKMQGWCDSPLTDLGKKQAEATRKYFEDHNIHFDHAYCSTLPRTEETLKRITDLPYTRMEGLKEFNYGTLEGESTNLACGKKGDIKTYYLQFGGESSIDVTKRMLESVTSIMEDEDTNSALVVSHGGSSFRLANAIDPKKARSLRKFNNCIIYEYEYEDGKLNLVDIIDEHVKDLKME